MSAMANTTPIDFCEEHYEDIMSVIMDKIRRDKRKEIHARLDFEESPKKRRIREGSQNLSDMTLSARACSTNSVILIRLAQLNPDRTEQIPEIILAKEVALTGGALLAEIVLGAGTALAVNHSLYVKMGRKNESSLSRVSESSTSDGGHWKSKSKGIDLRMRMTWRYLGYVKRGSRGSRKKFPSGSTGAARVWFDELPPESIDGYKDLKSAFLAYFMQQKKVNNPELTKHLNEHVPKTMEEMMIATTAFIRGEAAAAGKKKGHTSWRAQEQSKRQAS
ncbi:hypothetical protein Tco_0680080 [Tanacetum coccineum]|uniref:Reverse transcriptase domain-containing protein n=1 Tax=Tanacetum coccineum TaxID=301880 RepID=A0ABQ4XKF1_9ASTR